MQFILLLSKLYLQLFTTEKELLAWRNYRDKPDGSNILKSMKVETFWVAIKGDFVIGFASFIVDELHWAVCSS